MPDPPGPLHISSSSGHPQQNWQFPTCPTHQVYCTFPHVQVTPAELTLSYMPDPPGPLHLSWCSGHPQQNWQFPTCPTHQVHCTFPQVQVNPSRTDSFLHARPTRSTAHFLKFRSPPAELAISYMPDPPGLLHISSCSGHPSGTDSFLHARPTRSTAPFLVLRSPPTELTLSYMPDPPVPLHISSSSGHPQQN